MAGWISVLTAGEPLYRRGCAVGAKRFIEDGYGTIEKCPTYYAYSYASILPSGDYILILVDD